MKALLQRVSKASVSVNNRVIGKINYGLVVLLGVGNDDTEKDIKYLVEKTVNLRIFSDNQGKFNLSAIEVKAEILVISQFTLLTSTVKGRRPSFTEAAPPDKAEAMIKTFIDYLRLTGLKIEAGRFQAHMLVEIHNDGPVTIMLDSINGRK
ncbi:MAG: D-aminoacyl-tRNA deacylase [Chloroflexi bacterium]|nr:D-aminoacyl-tRNA deacylase [Chloroflexota bacterium]